MKENRIIKNWTKLPSKGKKYFWVLYPCLAVLAIFFYYLSKSVIGPEAYNFYKIFLVVAGLLLYSIFFLLVFLINPSSKRLKIIFYLLLILSSIGSYARVAALKQNVQSFQENYKIHQTEKKMSCERQEVLKCMGTSYYGGNIKCKNNEDCQLQNMIKYCNGLEIDNLSSCGQFKYFCSAFGDCTVCENCYLENL